MLAYILFIYKSCFVCSNNLFKCVITSINRSLRNSLKQCLQTVVSYPNISSLHFTAASLNPLIRPSLTTGFLGGIFILFAPYSNLFIHIFMTSWNILNSSLSNCTSKALSSKSLISNHAHAYFSFDMYFHCSR